MCTQTTDVWLVVWHQLPHGMVGVVGTYALLRNGGGSVGTGMRSLRCFEFLGCLWLVVKNNNKKGNFCLPMQRQAKNIKKNKYLTEIYSNNGVSLYFQKFFF